MFDLKQFRELARRFASQINTGTVAKPWSDIPTIQRTIQEFFNIHESTRRPIVQKGVAAAAPSVVVTGDKPVAVWIEAQGSKAQLDRQPVPQRRKPSDSPKRSPESKPDTKRQVRRKSLPSSSPDRTSFRIPLEIHISGPKLEVPVPRMHAHETPTEEAGNKPSQSETIRRTPHIDAGVPDAWEVGEAFKVEVYLDTAAAKADETSDDVEISAKPDQDEFMLRVWLTTSAHFQVVGKSERSLIVYRDQDRSSTAVFQVICVDVPRKEDPGTLVASIKHEGRPCGRVTRLIRPGAPSRKPPEPTPIEIRPNDRPVDLTVQITKSGNGLTYDVEVTSPLLPALVNGTRGPWPLADAAKWVTQCFSEFTASGLTPISRYERLGGGGRELFDGAPEIFKQAFWNLVSQPEIATKLKSILILSDEPYVPWELMIPTDGPPGLREFGMLGMEFVIGRWIRGNGQAPSQQLNLGRSLVVAPTYANNGSLKLKMADDEVRRILETIPGTPLRPVGQEILRTQFPNVAANLVHFICHGKSGADTPQALTLDDGRLSTRQLRGMDAARQFFGKQTPFVFLNACEVGRTQAALTGTDGFAPLFIRLGASAVIAPLWAIDDTVAHTIATEFYNRLQAQKSIRPAEVLGELRARAFNGDTKGIDSYAAYCFYGDPLATIHLTENRE